MRRLLKRTGATIVAGMLSASALSVSMAATVGSAVQTIHGSIDDTKRVVLVGNTRSEATAANDLGAAEETMPMTGMMLQLKASPERQAALKQYIDDLHNPKSANYHQWLTPAQFAESYGVAKEDVDLVTAWLIGKGFTVEGVAPTGLQISFSGNAGQVRAAFGTTIHRLSVKGVQHIANYGDPQIPAALQPAVAGIVSLHDFRPKPHLVSRAPHLATAAHPNETESNGFHVIGAPDLATIYNLTPLFAAGYSGKGQTIMVVEDTYLYSTADFTTFRKTYGLTRAYPYGTLQQVSPAGSVTCTNPGYAANGDDGEAAIDVEWASAAAPNASIILAACGNTRTVFGGLIALQNTLNGPAASLPSVVSISYGESEPQNGATANLSYLTTYQEAVAEGVSIFVSSGDELAESSDDGNVATHGISISGFASTPYNVAVGGTDFGYVPLGEDSTKYWSATNTSTYGSALSYMTEIPWNGSCASAYVAQVYGTSTTNTPAAFCNSSAVTSTSGADNFFDGAFGGSGGPSGCATGSPSTSGVVSGSCAGYAKPSWQSGLIGNPADGVRDIPDVSLFASNGIFDPYYAVCWSNPNTKSPEFAGFTCTGDPSTWAGFGGTSVSSPIMAAIQALVNQKTGSRWGNPNTVYYALANTEYGATGSAACNSSTVNKTSNSCKFYDITQGDIVGVCKAATGRSAATRNCYIESGNAVGISSLSNTAFQSVYPTTTGWDFGTGIGSVNAYNLVMGWPTTAP